MLKNKRVWTRRSFSHIKIRFSDQISLTSLTGAGKTTISKCLHEEILQMSYFWHRTSAGAFMRQKARELGFGEDIIAFNAYNQAHPELQFDKQCDEDMMNKGRSNGLIGEGRLAHICMPFAFKVLLVCPMHIRADRRARAENKSFKKVVKETVMRDVEDGLRFDDQYPKWRWPASDFDFVADTSLVHPKKTVQRILKAHEIWVRNQKELIAAASI